MKTKLIIGLRGQKTQKQNEGVYLGIGLVSLSAELRKPAFIPLSESVSAH